MTGNPLDRHAINELVTAHPEVEFALVLARTIESIRTDPEQLRGAIYELARQKLREQFTGEDPSEIKRLTAALEIAIQGVEAHSKKVQEGQRAIATTDRQPPLLPGVQVLEPPSVSVLVDDDDRSWRRPTPARFDANEARSNKRGRFATLGRFVLVVGMVLVAAAAIRWYVARDKGSLPTTATTEAPRAIANQTKVAPVEPPRPAPLLPTTFGTYAISAGKLYELESLQIRAPDIRVAVSAAITMPSRTTLPDGNVRFIVFRRDASGSAPDQVDVRVVAKIEQAMNFDPSGKPILSKTEENWVIRNISFPYRTAPVKDNPEMFEVQSKDAAAELTPGRYVLVIKGQAYDFTISGNVTDGRQCLGRVSASNGTFYSECQKLQ